jgi:hypothetical protein
MGGDKAKKKPGQAGLWVMELWVMELWVMELWVMELWVMELWVMELWVMDKWGAYSTLTTTLALLHNSSSL